MVLFKIIYPKPSQISKNIPIEICPTKNKVGQKWINSEKYPYDISEGIMFVIGIHEHRDQDYPKQSTVERWNTSTIDSVNVIGGLISNTKSLNHTDKPSGGFRSNHKNW